MGSEGPAERVLDDLFARIGRWQEQNEASTPEVQVGSDLAGDDDRLGYLHLSHVAVTSLVASVDEMDALRRLIVDARALTAYAPFTLLRAGLENASVTVWLVGPDEHVERCRRRLQLALQDNYDQYQVSALIADEGAERRYEKRKADILQLAEDLGVSLDGRRPFSGYERVVEDASARLSARMRGRTKFYDRDGAALASWKACSGLTHGAQWASVSMLQRVAARTNGDVVTNSVSASIDTVASAALVATDMIQLGYELLNKRRLAFEEH